MPPACVLCARHFLSSNIAEAKPDRARNIVRMLNQRPFLGESAGQLAIQALADFGLMEIVDSRFGRWTEAGKKFSEEIGYVKHKPTAYPGSVRLTGRSEPET